MQAVINDNEAIILIALWKRLGTEERSLSLVRISLLIIMLNCGQEGKRIYSTNILEPPETVWIHVTLLASPALCSSPFS